MLHATLKYYIDNRNPRWVDHDLSHGLVISRRTSEQQESPHALLRRLARVQNGDSARTNLLRTRPRNLAPPSHHVQCFGTLFETNHPAALTHSLTRSHCTEKYTQNFMFFASPAPSLARKINISRKGQANSSVRPILRHRRFIDNEV